MLTTDWVIAAVSGATLDGREITEEQIHQMGTSYDPSVYNARIWPEHMRGIVTDGLFKALGDVLEAKADLIKKGALAGKLALFVKLAPHADLISSVRNGQKVHLSIEMHPGFPTTGGAYLMGLGVTDSPASLGTEILNFSHNQRKEHMFSRFMDSDLVMATSSKQPAKGIDESLFSVWVSEFKNAHQLELDKFRRDFKAELEMEMQMFRQQYAEVKEYMDRDEPNGTPRPEFTGMVDDEYFTDRLSFNVC